MGKTLAMDELRKMQEADLLREISQQYRKVGSLKIAVESGKEKGSHVYKQEKLQLARMLTVLSELRKQGMNTTLSASAPQSGATADRPVTTSSKKS